MTKHTLHFTYRRTMICFFFTISKVTLSFSVVLLFSLLFLDQFVICISSSCAIDEHGQNKPYTHSIQHSKTFSDSNSWNFTGIYGNICRQILHILIFLHRKSYRAYCPSSKARKSSADRSDISIPLTFTVVLQYKY